VIKAANLGIQLEFYVISFEKVKIAEKPDPIIELNSNQ
jgi:hypothetical protein